MTNKRVLIVVSNPAVSTTTGWPVGFWASELIHPYDCFQSVGCEVTICSPDGGTVEFDAWSDPRDESGYSKGDTLSMQYIERSGFMALLDSTPAIDSLDLGAFDAIVVAGGQAPMFTFRDAKSLHSAFLQFHGAGKPSAALCHGVSLLLYLDGGDGQPFLAGKRITGFANSEEDFADQAVGSPVMPFRIEDEARKLGAEFVSGPAFEPHAIRDGNLVTGQQQHSGAETARLVLELLKGDKS